METNLSHALPIYLLVYIAILIMEPTKRFSRLVVDDANEFYLMLLSVIHNAFVFNELSLRIHLGISLGYRKERRLHGILGGLRLNMSLRDVHL